MANLAQQAADELAAKTRWNVPPIAARVRAISEQTAVNIFNVGEQLWTRHMGSLGIFMIFPCEPGKPYSKATTVPGIVMEAVPVDLQKMEYRQWDGREVAESILGIGPHQPRQQGLEKHGVFIAAGDKPTKDELDKARAELAKWHDHLIAEGDTYYNEGPQEFKNITGEHRKALRSRGQSRPWGTEIHLDNCPGCQEPIKAGVVKHTCGAVIDWGKAYELGLVTTPERPSKK